MKNYRLPFQVLSLSLIYTSFMFHLSCGSSVNKEDALYNVSLFNYNVTSAAGHVISDITKIPSLSTLMINIVKIPSDVRFIITEAHAFQYSVMLSYNDTQEPHSSVNGTNIGLVQEIAVNQDNAKFFLFNPNENSTVVVMITVQAYGSNAPIPGGCNMEFSVEIAPYLILDLTESTILVNSQPASAPVPRGKTPNCEAQIVQYEMYHMFLPERDFSLETYFNSLLKMMTVKDIQLYGRKVSEPVVGSQMRRTYSAYPGTGSVYAVIAKSETSASAYVPALTYFCKTASWSDKCEVLHTTFDKILCAVIFFLGLFVCFYGHQFFKTEMFLLGSLSGGLVFHILLELFTSYSGSETIVITVVLGMCFGALWLSFWWFYGIPVCSVLLATMTLGFIVAGIVSYAWLGDVDVLRSNVNYWLVFGCILLAVPILLSSVIHRANIISCAVLGAYAVIIPVDHYLGCNLKYIIVNIVRRATVKDFRAAIIDPPFQVRDTVLCAIWVTLAIVGTSVQLYKQRGKPPFPPPPYLRRRERSRQTSLFQRFDATERTPLLSEASAPIAPDLYNSNNQTSPPAPPPSQLPRFLAFIRIWKASY